MRPEIKAQADDGMPHYINARFDGRVIAHLMHEMSKITPQTMAYEYEKMLSEGSISAEKLKEREKALRDGVKNGENRIMKMGADQIDRFAALNGPMTVRELDDFIAKQTLVSEEPIVIDGISHVKHLVKKMLRDVLATKLAAELEQANVITEDETQDVREYIFHKLNALLSPLED